MSIMSFSFPLLQVGFVCNNAELTQHGLMGSPTEGAILGAATKVKIFLYPYFQCINSNSAGGAVCGIDEICILQNSMCVF